MLQFLACVLAIACGVGGADLFPPAGPNCGLVAPPAGAGEETTHGILIKIYPRLSDMPDDYTGCQTMWYAYGEGQWAAVNVVWFEQGEAVRTSSPLGWPWQRRTCHYRGGVLVEGDPRECVVPESAAMGSMPPGCVEKRRAGLHDGCDYD